MMRRDGRQPTWSLATLLLTALATSSCQALIGLDEVGPRPAVRTMDGAGGLGGAPAMAQGGSTAQPSPTAGAPCNTKVPLVSAATPPEIPAVATATLPTIDGKIDDIWCLARRFQPQLSAGDSGALAAGVSGQLLWDESHLYLLLVITDDVLYREAFFWYENDYAWVGVDPTPGEVGGDELLFGLTASTRDAQEFESWPAFDRTRVLIAHAQSTDTFTFEVSIPWDLRAGFVPATERALGFELRFADTDDGAAHAALSWANADEYSYEQPNSWGPVRLVNQD